MVLLHTHKKNIGHAKLYFECYNIRLIKLIWNDIENVIT